MDARFPERLSSSPGKYLPCHQALPNSFVKLNSDISQPEVVNVKSFASFLCCLGHQPLVFVYFV